MAQMKRRVRIAVGIAGMALLATACSGGEPTEAGSAGDDAVAQTEPMELTFNHTNPSGGHFEAATVAFTDYIEKATDGKVTFQASYSGALLPADEVFTGVGSQIADVSFANMLGFDDQFPVSDWLSPAMSVDTLPYPLDDLVSYAASNDFITTEPALQAEYEALNVKPLWMISSQPGDMLCADPIDGPADASGRLTRSPSASLTAELEKLDMTPISMPFADLYEGLERGAIECVYTTAGNTTFKPYGLTEVAKYYAPVYGGKPLAAMGFVMNLDLWHSLSPELQRVFEEASVEAMRVHTEGAFEVIAEFGATAEEDGVQFLKTDELRAALADLHAEQNASLVEDAPAGVENPEALAQKLVDYRAKWAELLSDGVVAELPEDTPKDGEGLRDAFASSAETIDWNAFGKVLQDQTESTE
jgi:TRAP-type transport system periplasmic protein